MFFPIPERNRKAASAARHLNEVASTIPKARPSELRYISDQLRDPSYLWKVLVLAYEGRDQAENRWLVRMVAFFWSAGVRPGPAAAPLVSNALAGYMDLVAFLLTAHHGLQRQELPTGGNRTWLFLRREKAIITYLKEAHPALTRGNLFLERVGLLRDIDTTIYCAREEASFSLVHKLVEHLDRFCLLPEDIGITAEELATWRHQRLVEQARTKFSVCRPIEFEGYTYDSDILNIYGVLLALTQGVSLEEAGITEDELRTAKLRLEAWLPDAIIAPEVAGVSTEGVISFNQRVMPMFDQVLTAGRHLRVVH